MSIIWYNERIGSERMKISSKLAQNIVQSIKEIINQEINFIDTDGIIIASTDQDRIGQKHDGALKVLKTKQRVVVNKDDEFQGTRRGINLPLYFEDEIIAVVGITGNPEDVSKYVHILTKMTEILIKEAYLQEMSYSSKENQRIIMENLLYNSQTAEFGNGASHEIYKYDVSIPRRAIQGLFMTDRVLDSSIYSHIQKMFTDQAQTILVINGNTLTILSTSTKADVLKSKLALLQQSIKKTFNLDLIFGIGSVCTTSKESQKSFSEAQESLMWAKNFSHLTVQFYEDLDLGILLLPELKTSAPTFEKKILGNLSEKEKADYMNLLKAYEKHNGSITKCSAELFIHKNTLQYRLNSLHEKTGFNPRDLNDYVILKLAFLIYEISHKMV